MRWLCLLCVLVTSIEAFAADWPQWLGPNRDGSTAEKVEPWKEAPKALWRVSVGEGHSSPVVAGGKVFVHMKGKGETETVAAYNVETGKEEWKTTYDRANFSSEFGNGPRATPAVVGKHVYTFGATGVLACFAVEDGKLVWSVDTLKDFKANNPHFGMSSSPLIEDGNVLVNVGGKGASIVAFRADTGKVAWQCLDDGASYSSPIVFGKGEKRQVVVLTAAGLVSLHPAEGKVHWQFPFVDKLLESSTTPVLMGDYLLVSSITAGSVGLKLGEKDGKPSAAQEWKAGKISCYFSTPIVCSDHVYAVTGSLLSIPPQAELRCLEVKTGKQLWSKPKVGKYHASLLKAGDQLLILEEGGDLVLISPNAEKFTELSRSKVCGETWAHPALVDGKLFVRDAKELSCLKLGK